MIRTLDITIDDKLLIVGQSQGYLSLWNLESIEHEKNIEIDDEFNELVTTGLSNTHGQVGANLLFISHAISSISIIEIASGKFLKQLNAPDDLPIVGLTPLMNDKLLFASLDHVYLWNITTNERLQQFNIPPDLNIGRLSSLAINSSEHLFALGTEWGYVIFYNINSGKILHMLDYPNRRAIHNIEFSDEHLIVASDYLYIYDLKTLELVFQSNKDAFAITLLSEERVLVSSSTLQRSLDIWQLKSKIQQHKSLKYSYPIEIIAPFHKVARIAFLTASNVVTLLDLTSFEQINVKVG